MRHNWNSGRVSEWGRNSVISRAMTANKNSTLLSDSSNLDGIKWDFPDEVAVPTPSGYYFTGHFIGQDAVASTASGIANRIWFSMFYIPRRTTFTAAAVNVVTNIASSNATLAIYDSAGTDRLPLNLIKNFGSVSCATTGAKEITDTLTLDQGLYWSAISMDLAGITFRTIANVSRFSIGRSSNTSINTLPGNATLIHTYGTMPDPVSGAAFDSNTTPFVWLKAQ